jgi:hypothetical protein
MIGRIEKSIEVPANLGWSKDFRLWQGKGKTVPFLIASATGVLFNRSTNTRNALTVGEGELVIVDNRVGVRLAPGVTPIGSHELELDIVSTTGSRHQVRAVLSFVAGL